ncbi:MAG TPA: hypothetical protein DIC52_17075 [Candidatus Latescibacteria bacterium]|jgi:ABC-2 type transport system permease protein|nr:hypothetical protein [Candidatus Latescibacterota bacterium]
MNKGLLVARHEYIETVRTKAFWLGLLAFPIIIALGIAVPVLLEKTKEPRIYAVIDHSGFLAGQIEERIYRRDLHTILAVTSEQKHESGSTFERLPQILRQFTNTYLSLDEADRSGFVDATAEIANGGEGRNLEGEVAEFVAQGDRKRLWAWWQAASVKELDQLDLELARHSFRRVEANGETETPVADLNRRVSAGELFAYFVIGPDPVAGSAACKYVSNNLTDRDLLDWYGRLATDVIRAQRIEQEGVDPEVARWVHESLIFEDRKVGARGADQEVATQDKARQWAPMVFTYLLWIAIFTSAQMLLTSTIEEKSARIIEVLLSSVSSFELMAGKIAGMAAAGLTVVASWVCFIVLAVIIVPLATGNPGALGMLRDIAAEPLYLFSFILYFLMGYLFYAAILVGIGSVCNSIKDAQSLMMPVIIPMMVALFALVPISRDPNGTLAKIMSFIPPFTPFVMMNRAAGPPAIWEYMTTTLLMAIAIYGAVWAAAQIFRIGVLMTGKPPTVRQMARWLSMDRAGTTPRSQEK